MATRRTLTSTSRGERKTAGNRASGPAAARNDIKFTHVDKVMFPDAGYTKADLLDYYDRVADLLIPHLRDRPLTLERLPEGVGGGDAGAPHFWQKNTPSYYPPFIKRARLVDRAGKPVEYALVNDKRSLLYLVNQGTITFHVFLSRLASIDRPDYVLFDLDPGERPFADAVKVARAVHAALDDERVASYPKTSGKSGIHLLAPWRRRDGGYDEARAWAVSVAQRVVAALPDIATLERRIDARGGRLYLDVMQNAKGHHVVPPYVVRAVPAATVSTPLEWRELTARLSPARFDLRSALKRFDTKGDLMKGLL
jgi:bifunctional non-homologous end joining protein LigD